MAKILVVDDDDLVIGLISAHLDAAGHDICVATDGRSALDMIAKDRPDALVLDALMPVLGGLDVLRALRASPATQTLPVMMLTARTSDEDVATYLQAGANEYLAKPFNARELVMRLEMMLRKAARDG